MNQDSSDAIERQIRTLNGAIGSVGIILLFIAAFVPSLIAEEYRSHLFELVMELVKDVGIAFVVAAIVGSVFELGARKRFEEAMRSDTVHAILGSWIGPDIWQDVNKQIFGRKALRTNFDITLELSEGPEQSLPDKRGLRGPRGGD